jgi:hypothetical protein
MKPSPNRTPRRHRLIGRATRHLNPAEIDLALRHACLTTDGESLELIYFHNALDAPNVLISQGSGGHGYVFAELAYRVHLWGFNVFVMPKHGGRTVNQLMSRHLEVLQYIRREFNDRIGLYGEGLVDMWPSTSPSHTRRSSASSAKTPPRS